MADRRDGVTWVALELTRQGELKVEDGSLEGELRKVLEIDKNWPIFIPARVYARSGKKITVHLMEGYVFVASGLDEVVYFRMEQENKIITRVMTQRGPHGMRVLATIPDSQIQDLREHFRRVIASDIAIGMKVKVTDGKYRSLEGYVVDVIEDYAIVDIDELRTLKAVAKIPRVFLEAERVSDE